MTSDLPDRKVTAAPPPRRKATVELDDTLGLGRPDARDDLELSGFTRLIGAEAPPAPSELPTARPERPTEPQQHSTTESAARKTTLSVPVDLVDRLRAWTGETGRTNADAVLSALLDCFDDVQSEFKPSPRDADRIRLGLSPISSTPATRSTQKKGQLGLFIQPEGLEALDSSAASLSLTRSALVSELLDSFLPKST